MSIRGSDWLEFSAKVYVHIETYTVPQYGDRGSDEADDFTAEDCIKHIKRYSARHDKNSRPGQDKLDLLKIAHYAQLAYIKLEEQENAEK